MTTNLINRIPALSHPGLDILASLIVDFKSATCPQVFATLWQTVMSTVSRWPSCEMRTLRYMPDFTTFTRKPCICAGLEVRCSLIAVALLFFPDTMSSVLSG